MEGRFDWFVDEFVVGENPDTIVVRSHSAIDIGAGATWGNKHVQYDGRYVQFFRFVAGKVTSFEEYYDTAALDDTAAPDAAYGG
ncbi:MAG: ketosteroid isomerase-like protein [Modestobacter sp.]|jgi:ketosteroid isomerase-like protein|nr:ketosteroid isomerase-like protein [Modestobacter sp.]